ncbi:MAG: CDP-alcohol phosphatidyltransferase family protein [Gemmatimonadota bacterium]|nr:CDP-alcohol phosphatidyltransferase family protein [Gemmatimonadota bacterium]
MLLSAVALALITIPIYVMRGRSVGPDPLAAADQRTFLFGSFLRDWFYWFLGPVVRLSVALRLSPLFWNLAGVVFGTTAGVCFALDRPALAGWAVVMGGIADILDGRVARYHKIASRRGAFLDSTLDRFAEAAVFVGLAVRFADNSWALTLVVAALAGSLLVSYTRARGESLGVLCKLGVMQRAERLILLGFGGILDQAASAAWIEAPWAEATGGTLLVPVLGLIAVGTLATAIFRTVWISRRLPRIDPNELR